MTESQLFDGEHCPRCGAEIEIGENENYAPVMTCPDCGQWGRMADYKGTPVLER
jgi:predicted RNA-binding Zn-ribbon protein involved in translation (DUF1610 family)